MIIIIIIIEREKGGNNQPTTGKFFVTVRRQVHHHVEEAMAAHPMRWRMNIFHQQTMLHVSSSHFQPSLSSSNFSSPVLLCPAAQSLALLQFKNSFPMMTSSPSVIRCYQQPKRVLWREGTDCCSWDGVTCNMKTGHVIGLHLGCSMLYGTLHSNSTLFFLHHLQKLDLSYNDLNGSAKLSRLASLDLSYNNLMLEPISFNKLAQNLTQLRELNLYGVNMSLVEPSSFMNLSSSLTSLQLQYCGLQGELPFSLGKLQQLEYLDLGSNNFIGPFPDVFANHTRLAWLDLSGNSFQANKFTGQILNQFSNLTQLIQFSGSVISSSFGQLLHLTHLNLSASNFAGQVPPEISHLSRLASLDLSHNYLLMLEPISFNKLAQNLTQLRELNLNAVNMSLKHPLRYCELQGELPFSLGKLKQLEYLDLASNHFIGPMPDDFANHMLSHLRLSGNEFTGQILNQFSNLTQLIELDLSNNKFDGKILSSLENLKKLNFLDLSSNNFTGEIPNSLFNLTQLTWLDLSNNKFYGQISSSPGNLTQLTSLDLSHNRFDGQISSSLGSFEKLESLTLSFNDFSGKIPNSLFNLTQLIYLYLSNNRLIGLPSQINRLSGLQVLLLSDNQLIGPIPSQISRLSQLDDLDLSHNFLDGTIPSSLFSMPSLGFLSLNNNHFSGRISPFLSNSLLYIDFSHNKLYGQIPPSVFKLQYLTALMLSSNDKLAGNISSVICKLKSLAILDFDELLVLNLGVNNFQGNIPSVYSKGNSLRYLNFNGNQLRGVIPPSVINCVNLEFLDLGNNMIDDTFSKLPELEVIILRSNKLHGSLKGPTADDSFSKLKLFDLSDNRLSGPLPTEYFNNFKAMMSVDQEMDYMKTRNLNTPYVYSVTMAWKGLQIEFTKIQFALTILDLSYNKFTGKIPESLGKLKSLIQLNLSHNSLIGYIQPSLGNLTNLESLDLSSNMLAGRIPQQLVDLTFLAVLNLSYNQLEGSIPQGKQFSTFEHGSYEGNLRLCGLPLKVKCNNGEGQQPPPSNSEKEDSMFEAVAIGYGCGFVFGVSMGYVVFRTRKPAWFVKMVERGGHQNTKRLRRKNAPRNGGRRH
uniref:Leucine-rich repeat-containing N-terminal plant-type domain-containing protein n=1 Tax=Salix viminalis TaxID=40686 RepID=A0A6N2KVG7_SALVM